MTKSIKELAWNVTEEEYRADPAVSYSSLATFERDGAKAIPTLKEKKTSEALRFGSLVDTMMTEPEELDNKFLIADISKTSEAVLSIVNKIYEGFDKSHNSLAAIDRNTILMYIKDANYYNNWKDDTRIDKIISEGKDYFSLLGLAGNKMLIAQQDFDQATLCVETLKMHPFTSKYFTEDFFAQSMEYHYQLKFKYKDNSVDVRCMFDRMIVDHVNKTIQPIDLKTTGKNEEEFEASFLSWSYWIQANMYSQILLWNIEQDEYFKDFTILPFIFVVINRYNRTPLAWVDNNYLTLGDRVDTNGNVHKHWLTLYKEFQWHVQNDKYDYSYDSYESNGLRTLNNIKIYDSGIAKIL